ncbi:YkuS family protein [Paenactinomyces guangxiensis]|uniref:YkuS family protein n=1 Tax=Paenactinomyces guangxiensis TaxID=1490290 RepID=A0A7W2A9D8_9BACL|nr:YkuS family protein [Paenactinomyces guangxiensis]MBA4495139.1 YkuS family protein [Paenactinomyces guangxiensis]MBH8592177.1 YkuS family protein [Paenactinomyces guangxiensis]
MNRIAVEPNLSPIREFLSQQGYQVEPLDASNIQNAQNNYSAIVISGMDVNLMGMQDIVQNCPVINAHGLTPEQVHERLQQLPQ